MQNVRGRCHEIRSPPLQSHRGDEKLLSPGGNISSPRAIFRPPPHEIHSPPEIKSPP